MKCTVSKVIITLVVVLGCAVPVVSGHEVVEPERPESACGCKEPVHCECADPCAHTHCCVPACCCPQAHCGTCSCQDREACGCRGHHHHSQGCDRPCEGDPNPSATSGSTTANEEPRDPKSYREGSFLLGAFWVNQFNTSVTLRTEEIPIGIFIDLESDLGLTDSVVVPRARFSYRFSRRHQVNVGYFRVQRDRTFHFDEELEIGDVVFPIGIDVRAWSDFAIYKAAYTWLFYDNDKVVLGASLGLNVVDFNIGISAQTNIPGLGAIRQTADATAPLPILGFRLGYRVSEKVSLAVTADTLLVEYGKYSGSFLDAYAIVDWRFAEHFSFGGGINFLNLDINVDEEFVGALRHNYRGVSAFMGVHF